MTMKELDMVECDLWMDLNEHFKVEEEQVSLPKLKGKKFYHW